MKMPPLSGLPDFSKITGAAADAVENLLNRIPDNLKTVTSTQQHVLLLTHTVPAARVRKLVPAQFELDTMKIEGEQCAFLQVMCAFNNDFHYTPLAKPSIDFWQLTYRVLTRQRWQQETPPADAAASVSTQAAGGAPVSAPSAPKINLRGEPGAFVLKSYVGAKSAWVIQRAVVSQAQYADFNVLMRGNTANAEYSLMAIDAREEASPAMQNEAAGAAPQNAAPVNPSAPTQIAARVLPPDAQNTSVPAPFATREKLVEFLTLRPHLFQTASLGRTTLMQTLDAPPMQPLDAGLVPVGGEVQDIRLAIWEELGILSQKEMRDPYSVLLQTNWPVVMNAPQLVTIVQGPTTTVQVRG